MEDNEIEDEIVNELVRTDDRRIYLFGDIFEDSAYEIISSLFALQKQSNEPIEFIISSSGGSAEHMLGIYDAMNIVKKTCEIHTFGIARVMSAAVLLLAAGTKGHRKISENCRVMIHPVSAGKSGSLHEITNEVEEIKYLQNLYVNLLSKETSSGQKEINKIMAKKLNYYCSAEEAKKMGIIDHIA